MDEFLHQQSALIEEEVKMARQLGIVLEIILNFGSIFVPGLLLSKLGVLFGQGVLCLLSDESGFLHSNWQVTSTMLSQPFSVPVV